MRIITLTSKNQVTIPADLIRQAGVAKGAKLQAKWQDNSIVLTPQEDFRTRLQMIQTAVKPYVKRPLSDQEIQTALRSWPRDR